MDNLVIGGRLITSRLFLGTGKFSSYDLIPDVIDNSGAEVVTVALRRVDPGTTSENMLEFIPDNCIVMPNTSGARTADEAIQIARLARSMGCGNWIKIEVISDNKYLLPDNEQTIHATRTLAAEGFVVLPYMNPDLTAARKMLACGAAAVMPLGSPIGSNRGLKTRELVQIMIDELAAPVIVDAGLGKPSDAAEAMEMGAAAVLVNTAIATAEDPVRMAGAFSLAVKAGRMAYLAGLGEQSSLARASSPLTGFLF
jgi:thiazole synthase